MEPTLVIGRGEIGSALGDVLSRAYDVYYIDPPRGLNPDNVPTCQVMHVCIPYSKTFNDTVKAYQRRFKPVKTVIHSTVPVGTSKHLRVYHSPVRGVHPFLQKGIMTFVKYLAPCDKLLIKHFERADIRVRCVEDTDTTEALKLWDTTYYGWNIIFEKMLHDWCRANGINFDTVYRDANETYNAGYTVLDRKEVRRPVLKHFDGPIGGHCVLPNLKYLESPIKDFIEKYNAQLAVSKLPTHTRQS